MNPLGFVFIAGGALWYLRSKKAPSTGGTNADGTTGRQSLAPIDASTTVNLPDPTKAVADPLKSFVNSIFPGTFSLTTGTSVLTVKKGASITLPAIHNPVDTKNKGLWYDNVTDQPTLAFRALLRSMGLSDQGVDSISTYESHPNLQGVSDFHTGGSVDPLTGYSSETLRGLLKELGVTY